jgi:hypothetical protein
VVLIVISMSRKYRSGVNSSPQGHRINSPQSSAVNPALSSTIGVKNRNQPEISKTEQGDINGSRSKKTIPSETSPFACLVAGQVPNVSESVNEIKENRGRGRQQSFAIEPNSNFLGVSDSTLRRALARALKLTWQQPPHHLRTFEIRLPSHAVL